MDKLNHVLDTLTKLENFISEHAVLNEDISKWSVGRHIGHCLLSTAGISRVVINSEPYTAKIKKNLARSYVFRTGTIPRGRGRAPQAAIYKDHTTVPELNCLLIRAKDLVREAAQCDNDSWWEHFAFGVMKRDDALKFITIHNQHHLKIIDDILDNTE